MPYIRLLPLVDWCDALSLFDSAAAAEGTLGWFQTLAQTTLGEGEESFLTAAFDDQGVLRAALPLVRAKNNKLRALTSPYTTLFAPALYDEKWSRFIGSQARSFVTSTLAIDALDLSDPPISAFVDGLFKSGLAVACFAHFENWFEEI